VVHVGQQFKISYNVRGVDNVRYADLAVWSEAAGIPHRLYEQAATIATFAGEVEADFCLAAGWYHMVPADLRARFPRGVAGLHASLLPRLRGGAPLNWAILSRETEAGITLFALGDGVDDGPIYGQERFPIGPRTTIGELVKSAEEGAVALIERCLPAIAESRISAIPQSGKPTYCLQRTPADGEIQWSRSAESIDRLVRAVGKPYPGAFSWFDGRRIVIWKTDLDDTLPQVWGRPGQIVRLPDISWPVVTTGEGTVVIKDATDEFNVDMLPALRRSGNKGFDTQHD
jgi:methionyl-tRNA formyltransferase